MITLFGINNCDTIKKTRKWLEQHDVDYHFHDYKKEGCSIELAQQFLDQFSEEQLINRRGTTWRRLADSIKQNLDRDSAIRLMHEQPSIIKRPLIKSGQDWIVGFDSERLEQLLT